MANSQSHAEKYFTKLLLGFASIITGVMLAFFAIFEASNEGKWYFWAIIVSFLLCGGIYFSLQAFVHKIKSDFSRRAKQRETHTERLNG
ncbi:MAG: hypothetical protein IPH18_01255 [Chitinophagaceae bacterium]|nr:hypothetical protein [Chitinophagaceae bacterium]